MVRYRVTKKGTILIVLAVMLIVGGTAGFILWRLNQGNVGDTAASASSKCNPCSGGSECHSNSIMYDCVDNCWKSTGQACTPGGGGGGGGGGGDCPGGSWGATDDSHGSCDSAGHGCRTKTCNGGSNDGAHKDVCTFCNPPNTSICQTNGNNFRCVAPGNACESSNPGDATCKLDLGQGNQGGGSNAHVFYCDNLKCSVSNDANKVCAARCDVTSIKEATYTGTDERPCSGADGLPKACECYDRQIDWFDGAGVFKGYRIIKKTKSGADCGTTVTNKCDYGYLDTPKANTAVKTGDKVTISGWAADSDSIDTANIDVQIDGVSVGKATAVAACPSVRPDVCANAAYKNPVSWSYVWTATTVGTHTIKVVWKDTKGATGTNCQGTSSVVVSQIGQPACKGMTVTGGQVVTGNRFVSNTDPLTVSVQGTDPDGAPKDISICYALDGQASTYYTTSGNWHCTKGTGADLVVTAGNVATYTLSGLTFDSMRTSLTVVPTNVDTLGFVFVTNITNNDGSNFCSTNIGYNNGTGVLSPGFTTSCVTNTCVAHVKKLQDANWIVSKTGFATCSIDQGYVRADYTITVKNIGTTSGSIATVVDTLDPKVQLSNILAETITPTGTVVGNVITWTLIGADAVIPAGGEKTFKYAINIPQSMFGTYTNNVKATPLGSSTTIDATSTLTLGCAPNTGLFDSTAVKIGLAMLLLILSVIYLYYDGFDGALTRFYAIFNKEAKLEETRNRFERKVTRSN